MNELFPLQILCTLLTAAVLVSAIGCVYSKHQSRKLFTELQGLIAERDRLDVDWGRLQIEQSTWSTHARVERLARKQMRMRTPRPGEILLVSP
jgi:cell division protein FtsL